MATSADRDDEDEKDKDEAPPEKTGDKSGPAKEGAAKASALEDEGDEEDDEEDKPASKSAKEDEEGEEDEKPAAPKRPGARGPGARGPGARGARGPGAARKAPGAQAPAGGGLLGKSVALFFGIVIILLVGFAYFARDPERVAKPKWKAGETVDLEVTLVKEDCQDLACASTDEVAGKHCAFEAVGKPWSKGPSTDDKVLKPYATADGVNFAAAGLWSNPDLAVGKIPATRFIMKCKYKVDGNIKLAPRWHEIDPFGPPNDWYAGTVSDCKIPP